MDEEEPLEFPTFFVMDDEDRPPPPSEDDFPVGCYVELVDSTTARTAQTAELWEGFMDALFKPKRRVLVKRHVGDYTFVICDDDPEQVVGCTLYRACLKEPKVKMRKYIPQSEEEGLRNDPTPPMDIAARMAVEDAAADEEGLFPLMETDNNEDDLLSRPVPPTSDTPVKCPFVVGPATGTHIAILPPTPQDVSRVPAPPPVVPSGNQSTHSGSSQHGLFPPSIINVQRSKKLVKRGNIAFADKKNDIAIKMYTEALELDRSDAQRVLSNRSAAFLASKNPEAALADARMVIRIAPRSHVGYVRAGNVFRQLKRFDEAKLCYEKALTLDAQKSPELQYSLLSNAVAAVYRSKTDHIPVSINLNKQMKIFGVCKRNAKEGDALWSETTSMIAPADPTMCDVTTFCSHCYRTLAKADAIAAQVHAETSTLLSLFREMSPVACHEGCGQQYCSDHCRGRAWTEAHWIECASKGRWAAASKPLRHVFDAANRANVEPSLIASVRIALRMLIKVLSSGKSLPEAVNIYTWLQEKQQLSEAELDAVTLVLQPAYMSVHECLTREERALLDFSFVVGLFKRCRQNMVQVTASPWPGIVSNAESHLALIRERGVTHAGLESVAKIDASELKGISITCWAVFEIFAVLLDNGSHEKAPNISLRKINETAIHGTVVALRGIEKGTQLVSTKPDA